jgi:hypothetical protein
VTFGWAGRIGLVLLVGINLTIICTGHDHGTGHTAPHLSVLGEPEEGAHGHDSTHTLSHASDLRATAATLLAATGLETLGLTLADVILALGIGYVHPPFRHRAPRAQQQGRPQTALVPERLPPRPQQLPPDFVRAAGGTPSARADP